MNRGARWSWCVAAVVGGMALVGCGSQRETNAAATQASGRRLEEVIYNRTGGIAGTNDWITIFPSGEVWVKGRLMGEGRGRYRPEEWEALVGAFAGWEQLEPEYLPERLRADGFVYRVQYGGKTVVFAEGADVPGQLGEVVRVVEGVGDRVAR